MSLSEGARLDKRKMIIELIGKFCNIKRTGSGVLGGQYRRLLDVGEMYLILEGDPKAGGGRQIEVETLEDIQEIQYREDKSLRGPFR